MRYTYLILIALLWSCGSDEPLPEVSQRYDDGVFVVNQGNFGNGTGTLTFYDRDTALIQEVYQLENDGDILGNVAQSMTIVNDIAFIAINNMEAVILANANDFTSIAAVSGIAQPRQIVSGGNGRIYISAWGSDGLNGAIHVVNLSTFVVESSIPVKNGPEDMEVFGNIIYISQSGGFGRGNQVYLLDTDINSIVDSVQVADNVTGLVRDENSDIWALSSGFTDFTGQTPSTDGGLTRITSASKNLELPLPNGAGNLVIDRARENLYYTLDNEVYRHNILDEEIKDDIIYSGSIFAMGIDPDTGFLHLADAKDFISRGEVVVIDIDGEIQDRYEAGIIPGSFTFR